MWCKIAKRKDEDLIMTQMALRKEEVLRGNGSGKICPLFFL